MLYAEQPKHRLSQSQLILLAILGVAILMAILSSFHDGIFEWRGLLGNLSTELMGAVITYVIIERIVQDGVNQDELKKKLIRRLENPQTGVTWEVIQELRHQGWLEDGSLYGWFLKRANLSGVSLMGADLNGLGLYRCNLKDVRVTDQQLASLKDLRRTIMPDGEIYDGRYCLSGDLEWARTHYGIDVNTATHQQMADYYEVPLERYIEGQQWALEHLPEFGISVPNYLQKSRFHKL